MNDLISLSQKKYYDLDRALEELEVIEFKQYNNIQKGSKVYIYIPTPYEKAIQYECEAVVVDKKRIHNR